VQPSEYHSILKCLHAEGLPRLKAANSQSYWTRSAYDISGILILLARRWVKPPPETLDAVLALHKRVKPTQNGLSEKVQARLAEFMTDTERQELFQLPWRAFKIADKMLHEGDSIRASKLHETALALIIVLESSLRLGDLAKLHLKENFQRDRKGRIVNLVVRTTKTTAIKWAEIEEDLAQRIERHTKFFRPHIPGYDESDILFPSAGGRSRFPSSLGRLLHRLVAQQLGKHFTTHLARHLAVDIILDANPANMALAQRQLGHRSLATTSRIYGSRATLASSQYFKQSLRAQAQRAENTHDGKTSKRKRSR
jgi:integrase